MKYSIICPLCDDGTLLPVTLRSFFQLDCLDYEVIFAAEPTAHAAIVVADSIRQQYPQIPSQIIIDSAIYCVNPKLNNVQKGWLVATGIWVIMTDCNMLLPVDAIQRLEARWDPTTGMVCSPPVGSQPDNFWAEVECAFLNMFEAKWQILADRLGHGFAQGKVMFCQKVQLQQLGGLHALDHAVCEDAAATKLIRGAGLRVRLVSKPFEQPLGHRFLRTVWDRQLRWAKLRRVTFPLWYAMELLVTPILFLITLMVSNPAWPLLTFGMFYLGEMLLAWMAGWYLSWRTPFAMIVRDILMMGVWITGWFGDTFHWAGQELSLRPIDESKPLAYPEDATL